MWLEIIKIIVPFLYFVVVLDFARALILKGQGCYTEKEYYHSLHEALERVYKDKQAKEQNCN